MYDKVEAYAVFSGGGVRGVALAGALKTASERFDFQGFGGTSAGAIIACLASARMSGDAIFAKLSGDEATAHPSNLFKEEDRSLKYVGDALHHISRSIKPGRVTKVQAAKIFVNAMTLKKREKQALGEMFQRQGMLSGRSLADALTALLAEALGHEPEVIRNATFAEWGRLGGLPLRVVASDIATRTAVIFDDRRNLATRVVDAVVASASFPFAFQAQRFDVASHRFAVLLDGGLASNSPSFLFAEEFKVARSPTVVFRFAPPNPKAGFPKDFGQYVQGVVDTAVNASDGIIDDMLPHTHDVFIHGADETALFEDLDQEDMRHLFACGQSIESQLDKIGILQRRLQPLPKEATGLGVKFGNTPPLRLVLRSFRRDLYLGMKRHGRSPTAPALPASTDLRVSLFVPTTVKADFWKIALHVGFNGSSDIGITLRSGEGCVGTAVQSRDLVVDSLSSRSTSDPPAEEQDRVPATRLGVVACPVFEYSADGALRRDLKVIAVIAADTSLSPADAGWVDQDSNEVLAYVRHCMVQWSDVFARLLAV